MGKATALVERLKTAGSDLSSDLADEIVARAGETMPLLLEMLAGHGATAEHAATDDCEACGAQHDDLEYAPLHAVDLLADIGDPRAIDAMVKVLETTSPDESIHDKVVERLPNFGGAALESILQAHARTPKEADLAESLCCVLAALDVRDPRVLQALLELLKTRPRAAAVYLAEYGDAAACPPLLDAIRAAKIERADLDAQMEWLDVIDAYTTLGGELPQEIRDRMAPNET
ncbi:MAG: hypothetical protein ABW133_14995 [Polyangiaceae bacterium]